MSSPQRRKELARLREEQQMREAEERARKDALSMWARIDEADASEDIKDILHRIAEHVGLEQ